MTRMGLGASVRSSLVAGMCVAVIAGCSGGTTQSMVNVGTTEVKGSVGGVVLDAIPGLAPLAGVAVTVVAGSLVETAATDDNGIFSLSEIPAGSVVIRLSVKDHFDVLLTRTLEGSAGNFPLSNPALTIGPIAMIPSTGSFKVRLLDELGGPVPNTKVVARTVVSYLDLSSGAPTNTSFIEASATSGPDGLVNITPLPDYNAVGPVLNDALTISVPPIPVMGAGEVYSFLGADFPFNGRKVPSQTPNIVLAGPHTAVQVLTSTLDYLMTGTTGSNPTLVNIGGPISVVFNQAINPVSVRANLYNENGALAANMMPSVRGNVVELSLGARMLDPATRYNLELHVSSLATQAKEYNVLAPVFTRIADPNTPVTAQTSFEMMNSNDATILFSEPVGVGSGSTAQLSCIVFYETDLDGNGGLTSPGEWSANGNNSLKCVPGDPHPGYYLRPDEPTFTTPSGNVVITGFTRRWRLAVRPFNAVCVGGFQCCVGAAPLHFVFTRNPDANAVVRRLNGAPLPDMSGPQLTVPPYACN